MNDVPLAELWISVSADVNGAIVGLNSSSLPPLIIKDEEEAVAFLKAMIRAIAYKPYKPYLRNRLN